MKTSEKIKQRLIDKKIRFFANDNISKHIEKGELKDLEVEIEEAFEDFQQNHRKFFNHTIEFCSDFSDF